MIKTFRLYAVWPLLLFIFLQFFAAGCGEVAVEPGSGSTPVAVGERSPEEQFLVGKWAVNQGRFGDKIFDFQTDGRLLIEDAVSDEMLEMAYVFVAENTIALSGYDEFDGAATINFYENKMDFTVNFAGNIYGERYTFTRVAEASD